LNVWWCTDLQTLKVWCVWEISAVPKAQRIAMHFCQICMCLTCSKFHIMIWLTVFHILTFIIAKSIEESPVCGTQVTHHPAGQISHSLSENEQGRNLFFSFYDTSFQLLSGCWVIIMYSIIQVSWSKQNCISFERPGSRFQYPQKLVFARESLGKAVKVVWAMSRCIFLLDLLIFIIMKLLNGWLGIKLTLF
jgi:hypothetical protein